MKTLTLAEYRALEAAGRIRRPLTDDRIGAHTSARRATDEANSRHVTPRPQPKETTR